MIKKIVLDIDGKEVELTPEQAMKLHKQLDDLFGKKNQLIPMSPYRPYDSPSIQPAFPPWEVWKVTCGENTCGLPPQKNGWGWTDWSIGDGSSNVSRGTLS